MYFLIYLFWLCRVFITALGLSPVAEAGVASVVVRGLVTAVPSLAGARALAALASVVAAHGLSCSAACGIVLGQGSNLCPLHWQAVLNPLDPAEPNYYYYHFLIMQQVIPLSSFVGKFLGSVIQCVIFGVLNCCLLKRRKHRIQFQPLLWENLSHRSLLKK